MNRQILIWILLVPFGLFLLGFLVTRLGLLRLPLSKISAYEAVPENTAFLFEINDYHQTVNTLESRTYRKAFEELYIFKKLFSDLSNVDSLFSNSETGRHILRSGRIVAAAQLSQSNDFDYVYIIDKAKRSFDLDEFANVASNGKVQVSKFRNHQIYEITDKNGNQVALSFFKGLIIISKATYLVEYSTRQLDKIASNITRDAGFKKIKPLTGTDGNLTLFINLEHMGLFSSCFLTESAGQPISALSEVFSWVGLDFFLTENTIVFNGYTVSKKLNRFWQGLLKQDPPKQQSIEDALPNHTAFALAFRYHDMAKWMQIAGGEDADGFKTYFLPWIGDEMAYVITEPLSSDLKSEQLLIFKVENANLATELLDDLGRTVGEGEPVPYQNYEIRQLLTDDLLQPVFGDELNTIHQPYYVQLDRFVVMGNSIQELKLFIDKYNFGQTLNRDANYLQLNDQLPSTENVLLYVDPAKLFVLLKNVVKPELNENLTTQFKSLQRFSPMQLKWSPNNKLFLTSGQIAYSEGGVQPTSVVWKTDLLADALIPPQIVYNQRTKEDEVFVQDVDKRIYVLNRGGEIRWSRIIDGPIQSDIYQIDVYKNGKLQYLFNTRDKMYLIDREGDDVKGKGYPRAIRNATNGIFVVDYDGKKDYRIFVASSNGGIYGYKKDGAPLPGWNPLQGVGQVFAPMQHFSVDGKDYLIALNEEGLLHAFARNGNRRFDAVQLTGPFLSDFGVDVSSRPHRIVAVNEEGKTFVTNLTGEFFSMNMKPGKRRGVRFAYDDVVHDFRKDYIALSERTIVVHDHDEKVYTHEFEENQGDVFTVRLSGQEKALIGTVAAGSRKIYLLDETGSPYPDFPLAGTTKFLVADLYGEGNDVLIVANGAVVYAYRLNRSQ